MKKAIVVCILLLFVVSTIGCSRDKTLEGKTYIPYGLATKEQHQNPNVAYRVRVLNIILAVILVETIIVPIYIVGWDLWEPYDLKINQTADTIGVKINENN